MAQGPKGRSFGNILLENIARVWFNHDSGIYFGIIKTTQSVKIITHDNETVSSF
jgi:hypothetical protein